jgi:heat shock protein HspQ
MLPIRWTESPDGIRRRDIRSLPAGTWKATAMQSYHRVAKFGLGQVVRHRHRPFRGVIFDVDPEFANTQEWYDSIPEDARPAKNQPFYHLYAETEATYYVAYVSEQNLEADASGEPLDHPDVMEMFSDFADGSYRLAAQLN